MEISKIFSYPVCSGLSDGIDFANGIKKTGFVTLKTGAVICATFAVVKLYQYAVGTDRKQKLVPNIEWNSKGITSKPISGAKEFQVPTKDKEGKVISPSVRTVITIPPIASGVCGGILLGASAIATYLFWNAIEGILRSFSKHLQCHS